MDQDSSFVLGHLNKSHLLGDGKLSQEGQPDQVTAKQYLQKAVFVQLEEALNVVSFLV